jgi:hypothetical protein
VEAVEAFTGEEVVPTTMVPQTTKEAEEASSLAVGVEGTLGGLHTRAAEEGTQEEVVVVVVHLITTSMEGATLPRLSRPYR